MRTSESMVVFAKMNGLGNKILIADLRNLPLDTLIEPSAILNLAKSDITQFDQMMVIYQAESYIIKIYNADCSMAGACGNGMRCVSKYIFEQTGEKLINCLVENRILVCEYKDENNIFVSMGQPDFSAQAIGLNYQIDDTSAVKLHEALPPAFLVSVGNPHAVFFLSNLPEIAQVKSLGKKLEHHPIFTNRCNISFAKMQNSNNIKLYTWERGAGLTQACGSAACASLIAAIKLGLASDSAYIHCLGGVLETSWKIGREVILGGKADLEFYGKFNINNGEFELWPPK